MFTAVFRVFLRATCAIYVVLALGLAIYWAQVGRYEGQLGSAYLLGALFLLYMAWFSWRASEPKKRSLSFRERMARRQANRAKRQPPKGPNPYALPPSRDEK